MNLRTLSVSDRRNVIEKQLGVTLHAIGSSPYDHGCENMIGSTQIPIGIAGPVNGTYIPLATTEGALVASVNRGCKALTMSGGASVMSYRVGTTRGPVFKVKNMAENERLFSFIETHKKDFNAIAQTTSRHITLTGVDARSVGLHQFVRFTYDTQDAMGMNMATIATKKIVDFIVSKTSARCVSLAGNYDVDKKPSWLNVIKGRGFEVWAEGTVTEAALQQLLKTSAQKIYDVWLAKCMIGSAISGSMAFNAQFANIIAALFIATGQDPAHVVEGSLGMTTCEIVGTSLYISVHLPDLLVGTVGGGTGLATQKEALSILGVKTSQEFAEVAAAAVLAGELSLLASLSEGTLAKAHEKYGRNR